MRKTFLYSFFIILLAVLIIPGIASAQVVFGLDFDSYPDGTTLGTNWTSSTGGNCNAQVVDLMGNNAFEMALLTPPAMGDFAQLVVGPIDMSAYNNKQVILQWENAGQPFDPGDSLTFEVVWTGPSAGSDIVSLTGTEINNAPLGLNTVMFNSIPDDAVQVTLTATSLHIIQFSAIFIDNISFNGARAVPTPTMTEWGMIIFMVLAGLSSVYYIRRKSRVS